MQTITIVPFSDGTEAMTPRFRAVANGQQANGRTVGGALDALTAQFPMIEPTLVLIQKQQPDAFFTQKEHDRLEELMARRGSLAADEQEELEALIDTELDATIARTDAWVRQLSS